MLSILDRIFICLRRDVIVIVWWVYYIHSLRELCIPEPNICTYRSLVICQSIHVPIVNTHYVDACRYNWSVLDHSRWWFDAAPWTTSYNSVISLLLQSTFWVLLSHGWEIMSGVNGVDICAICIFLFISLQSNIWWSSISFVYATWHIGDGAMHFPISFPPWIVFVGTDQSYSCVMLCAIVAR